MSFDPGFSRDFDLVPVAFSGLSVLSGSGSLAIVGNRLAGGSSGFGSLGIDGVAEILPPVETPPDEPDGGEGEPVVPSGGLLGEQRQITGILVFDPDPTMVGLKDPEVVGVLVFDHQITGVLVFDPEPETVAATAVVRPQGQITGVLVLDSIIDTVGVTTEDQVGGVVVFDGSPSLGAITHYAIPGVTVTATTGPRGKQGIQGIQGIQGHAGFVLVEPGEDPPADTPDGTFVYEHAV